MSEDTKHWAIEILKNFGVPTAMLIALSFAIWQALTWAGTNLALPLINKQIATLEKMDDSQEKITNTLAEIHRELKTNEQITTSTKRLIEANGATIEKHDEKFSEIISVLRDIDKSIKNQK